MPVNGRGGSSPPSDTLTIYTRAGLSHTRPALSVRSESPGQALAYRAAPMRPVSHRPDHRSDIAERVDHRVDLGIGSDCRSPGTLLDRSLCRRALGLCLVHRVDERGRVHSRRRSQPVPPQPSPPPRASRSFARVALSSLSSYPVNRPARPPSGHGCSGSNRSPIHPLTAPTTASSRRFTVRGWSASAGEPGANVRAGTAVVGALPDRGALHLPPADPAPDQPRSRYVRSVVRLPPRSAFRAVSNPPAALRPAHQLRLA